MKGYIKVLLGKIGLTDEQRERIKLAWNIIFDRDTSLVHHVRREVGMVDKEVSVDLTNIARVFSICGFSGGSAPIVIPWINQTLSWGVIAPLTGEDDEWEDVSLSCDTPTWQNRRCLRIFKNEKGDCYDISGRVFRDQTGAYFTNRESRTPVTFPYTPTTEYVDCVV